MHGDDELCRIEGTALLGICQIPYPTKDLVRQSCALKDLFRNIACTGTAELLGIMFK